MGAGITTDSNINNISANDILASVEDSNWHLWPDTTKPYTDSYDPFDGETNVLVTDNIVFHFKDDETGVDTSTLKVKVKKQGGSWQNYTSYASFSCSGLWGTNDCTVTVNPPGTRNWDYYTTYEVELEDGEDNASPSQNPNGPNKMDDVEYEFTTQPDIWAPYAQNYSPTKNATGVSVNTNVAFDIVDIESGITGTGVNLSTVKIMVKGEEFCQSSCASTFLNATPLTLDGFTYGYRITVDPAGDFSENEIVSVSIYNATDNDIAPPVPTPNVMVVDNYIFTTVDTQAPYFTDHSPAKGAYFAPGSANISFHAKDDGRGVDIDTVSVQVGTTTYTRTSPGFSYSGDSSDYYIEIETGDFTVNQAVPIKLQASDVHMSPANSTEEMYAIFYLEDPDCPSCPSCPSCSGGGGGGGYCSPCPSCPENGVCLSCPSCSEQGVCPSCKETTCPSCPQLTCPEKGYCPSCPECSLYPVFPEAEEMFGKILQPAALPASSFISLEINNQPLSLGGTAYIDKENIIFKGESIPNAEIILEVYSELIVLKTSSDEQGYWTIKIKTELLDEGEHKVFAQAIKEGKRSERINLAKIVIAPETISSLKKICLEEKIANWWERINLWQKILILLAIVLVSLGILRIIKRKWKSVK